MKLLTLSWLGGFALSATVLADSTKHNGYSKGRRFHMTFQLPGAKLNRRSLAYITSQGYITTDQSQATVFSIENGQLASDGQIVSADPNDDYIPFAADSTVHSISTTWTQNPLTWTSSSFAANGVATYCQGSDSRIYLVLQSPPSECEAAVAHPVPLPSTTATTATTASSTSTSSVPTPTVEGLAYYGYKNPNNYITPSTWNPNDDVDISGIIQNINFVLTNEGNGRDWNYTFPGQDEPTNAEDYAIVFQGFFRANVSGTYTLTATSNTDDNSFLWVGDIAYSRWGNGNYNATTVLFQSDGAVTVTVNAGDFVPVTFLWINTSGNGAFYFNILNVDSGVDTSDTTGYFLAPVEGDGFSETFIPNPPTPPPPGICPDQNGGTVTVGYNPYYIQCGSSYASLAFTTVTATSLTDCFTQCNAYQGFDECVTASYDETGGECYLSKYGYGGVATTGVDSGTSED